MSSEKRANPIPQGKYVPATRAGNVIFTAGMTPRKNGVLILEGKVNVEKPLEFYREAVYQATSNAVVAAQNILNENEEIVQILSMTVYVNAEEDFIAHSKLADFATDFLIEELGTAGVGSRTAIGVASLPNRAPVEIQIICRVDYTAISMIQPNT